VLVDRKEVGTVSARASSPGDARMLFGRDKDLELLRAFVDEPSAHGHALLLSGAPGVGKTVLLDSAARHARDVGMRVLRAAGTEFEADLSFSGLNQVLHPSSKTSNA